MGTYYAVIFTSQRTEKDETGYESMSAKIEALVREVPGFIRLEGMGNPEGQGITVSYWKSLDTIRAWKVHTEHQVAQQNGKEVWYSQYIVEVCKIIRAYSFLIL